jgi:murein L,D-transpeptidase YafK
MGPSGEPSGASHSDMIMLTVDKSTLHAELKTWPEDPAKATTLKTFRIAIGKAEGDKEHEGDNKTPEGIYFALSHIDGSALPVRYGRKAIPIDFPNPMDRADGKTGHGIWLHGVERDTRVDEAKVTEGCVAFYNADINSLANWLKDYQGVVVIAKDVSRINSEKDLTEVKKRTQDWMAAWSTRHIDDYVSFYAPDFRFEKMNFEAYRDYKKRVFGSYKVMNVSFDNIRVVTHPKYAVSFFNQDFHGDKRFTSIGRKALYWEKDKSGQWMIKREVFENRRFEFMTFTDAELALLSDSGSGISSDKEKKAPNL